MSHYDDDQTLFLNGTAASASDLAQIISGRLGFTAGVTFDNDPTKNNPPSGAQNRSNMKQLNPLPITLTPLATAMEETLR